MNEMVQDSVREAMESLKRLRKPTSLFELCDRKSVPMHPPPKDEEGAASRLSERLAAVVEKLAAQQEEDETVDDGELERNKAAPASKLGYTCVNEMYAQRHVHGILLTP